MQAERSRSCGAAGIIPRAKAAHVCDMGGCSVHSSTLWAKSMQSGQC